VAKGLIFKVKFNCRLTVGKLNQSKENFNRSFRNGLQRVRLAELNFIAINLNLRYTNELT